MKILLASSLLIVAVIAAGIALYTENIVIGIFFMLVAVDLVATVFVKPIIGPGPIAKFLYPSLENEQERSVQERQENLAGNEANKIVGHDAD